MEQNIDQVDIGYHIKQTLRRQERSGAWLARKLFTDASNVSKLLKRKHIDTELLLRISLILDEDFFAYYSEKFRAHRRLRWSVL